jgi:phosphoribosylformylglycinamidine synthase
LDEIPEKDLVKILFSENPGILIQVEKTDEVEKILKKAGVAFIRLARPCDERHLLISGSPLVD